MARQAIVLFAHGARDPQWSRPFQQLVVELGELRPGERIVLAFLELMRPSLAECVDALHAEGIRNMRVVPVFFGAGGHLKIDLPGLISEIRKKHKDIEFTIEPPIGEQPEVIAAIARAIAR